MRRYLEMTDLLGLLAGAFVVLTFYSTDHQKLRQFAIVSNVLFITYAMLLQLWPILVLHSILLPLNWKRLSDLQSCSWFSDERLFMSECERKVFLQGLVNNPHSWAMYGAQRVP